MYSAKDAQLMEEYVNSFPDECKDLLDELENIRCELECLSERALEFYEEYDIPQELDLRHIADVFFDPTTNKDEYNYGFEVEELFDLVEALERRQDEEEKLCNQLIERARRWKESQKTGKG